METKLRKLSDSEVRKIIEDKLIHLLREDLLTANLPIVQLYNEKGERTVQKYLRETKLTKEHQRDFLVRIADADKKNPSEPVIVNTKDRETMLTLSRYYPYFMEIEEFRPVYEKFSKFYQEQYRDKKEVLWEMLEQFPHLVQSNLTPFNWVRVVFEKTIMEKRYPKERGFAVKHSAKEVRNQDIVSRLDHPWSMGPSVDYDIRVMAKKDLKIDKRNYKKGDDFYVESGKLNKKTMKELGSDFKFTRPVILYKEIPKSEILEQLAKQYGIKPKTVQNIYSLMKSKMKKGGDFFGKPMIYLMEDGSLRMFVSPLCDYIELAKKCGMDDSALKRLEEVVEKTYPRYTVFFEYCMYNCLTQVKEGNFDLDELINSPPVPIQSPFRFVRVPSHISKPDRAESDGNQGEVFHSQGKK